MKKTLIIIGSTILAIVVIAWLGIWGLAYKRDKDHEFGNNVLKNGPWGTEEKWVSEDESFIENVDGKVIAYFMIDGEEVGFELDNIDRLASLSNYELSEYYGAKIKFDGETFTLKNIEAKKGQESRLNDRYDYKTIK